MIRYVPASCLRARPVALTSLFVIVAVLIILPASSVHGQAFDRDDVLRAIEQATAYFREHVAQHGGYVYYVRADLQQRFGEGEASPDQIWVQPPGTPTVGMSYLTAYRATADAVYLQAATETAKALIYGQLESGGWQNCVDFNPNGDRVSRYRNGRGKGRNFSSLDDDQTQAAIRFLMAADRAHNFQHADIHEAARFALTALLSAQFSNGGFPQVWDGPVAQDLPDQRASFPADDWRQSVRIKNYWDHYTLNDGLASCVAKTLVEASRTYDNPRYLAAAQRLGDFLIKAQLPDPQPAWSQQYGYDMKPIWARKFEPPAIAGRESEDAIEALLILFDATQQERFLTPIPAAIDYLRGSQLPDGRLARYYELRTNRPLYMRRDGDVYTPTYDDGNLPGHYSWKTTSHVDRLAKAYSQRCRGESKPRLAPSAASLHAQVAKILSQMDEKGGWIETYQGQRLIGSPPFQSGDRYLSSATFARHVSLLSRYLETTH